MPNPQQPEIRRSEHTATTDDAATEVPEKEGQIKGRPHGTDKGNRGGGEGGGTPPDQRPPHPS